MQYTHDDFNWYWGKVTVRVYCKWCGAVTGATLGSKNYPRERTVASVIETYTHFDSCALERAAGKAKHNAYMREDFYVVAFTEGVGIRCVWCLGTSPLSKTHDNTTDEMLIPMEMHRVKHKHECALERVTARVHAR